MPKARLQNSPTLYYEQHGQGPDLLLIGGLSADHTVRSVVLDTLARAHRVTVFDNRGAGQSDAPAGPYSLAQMAGDTVALMDALAIKQAAIAGHSMGGAILQQLCFAHPARVSRAIICASAAKIPLPSLMHVESVGQMQAAKVAPELIFLTAFPWIFGPDFLQDRAKVDLAMRNLLQTPWPQTLEAYRAQVEACTSTDFTPLLPNMTTKTLILAGRDDLLTPLRCAEEMHRGIPGSRLQIIEHCGHMIPLEQPEQFCTQVTAFLAAPL